MERQRKGFEYEKEIIERFSLRKEECYTGKWDAYYNNIPVSIKYEKFGSDVELADFFRQAAIQEDFYLMCGFDNGEEHLLFIPYKEWHKLFDSSFEPRFKTLLSSTSNERKDDTNWKNEIAILKKEWQSRTPNLIRPRFKRDHKKQKRVQCAINNKDFYEYFIPRYEVKNFERDN